MSKFKIGGHRSGASSTTKVFADPTSPRPSPWSWSNPESRGSSLDYPHRRRFFRFGLVGHDVQRHTDGIVYASQQGRCPWSHRLPLAGECLAGVLVVLPPLFG